MTEQPDETAEPGELTDDLVRPFLITGGRTAPSVGDLRADSMVQAAPAAAAAPLQFEQLATVQLCQQPLSVAEIAAALRVPLGVARVVVGDLMVDGYVSAHTTGELSTAVVERIRDLVRAL